MVRRVRSVALICAVSGLVLAQSTAHAQVIAPSQFTPQSLRPETRPNASPLNVRGPSAITMPAGDNRLTVLISHLDVEGGRGLIDLGHADAATHDAVLKFPGC